MLPLMLLIDVLMHSSGGFYRTAVTDMCDRSFRRVFRQLTTAASIACGAPLNRYKILQDYKRINLWIPPYCYPAWLGLALPPNGWHGI
ncbi:hypothetical protein [Psychrobacter luti]|uniref:hypothetical protein n=1 Tax=Psychrobacter luti TaxID=198481 RepID=UPI00160EEE5F|nr:hypothetical protein [Psychrobacter luti]